MDHYVLGFIFSHDIKKVLLVNKQRPDWQKDKWNGVGGHIEKDEHPYPAMRREIDEEIEGLIHDPTAMTHRITFTCPGGTVWVYKSVALHSCKLRDIVSRTDEPVQEFYVNRLGSYSNLLDSMLWLIPLVLSDVQGPILLNRLKKSV